MYSFRDDYSEGCLPQILTALSQSNLVQQDGYGDDEYSKSARKLIQKRIQNPEADIHFVSGGTQANLLVIAAALRPYEAVVCATTGHIAVHEAGAIESTGHKVLTCVDPEGKVRIEAIERLLEDHSDVPHMVKPKLVYISNSTEIGTIYKKEELETLYDFCKKKDLYLFLDGARLGSALCARSNDISLEIIAKNTDAFYIGGTKNGALLGEAIVLINKAIKNEFAYHVKQRGALLAKGRLLGIQFYELFKENLYFEAAQHANAMAEKLFMGIKSKGYTFLSESETNQIFPIFPNQLVKNLSESYGFYTWKKIDEKQAAIRLVTSWATTEKAVKSFLSEL